MTPDVVNAAATSAVTKRPYVPPPWLEYLYFAQMFYSIMGPAIGLSFNNLGILLLIMVAGVSAFRLGKHAVVVFAPVLVPMACAASYLAVQMVAHGRSIQSGYVREFVPWMVSLAAVHYLALRRGFLHRAAFVVLLIGASTLPFLRSFRNDASRVGLEGIGIGNPNDLGAWFGFCCVYLAITGLEARRTWIRVLAFVGSLGCLFIVGLTVSRGPLLAVACSIVFAFRRVLRRGFAPCMALIVIGSFAYSTGMFDQSIGRYLNRGLEETGRLVIWPLAIGRFLESPWIGVGADQVGTLRPQDDVPITPHNGFIFVALAGGVVPAFLFVVYWIRMGVSTYRLNANRHEDSAYHTSLVLYSFLVAFNLNEAFMTPWMVVTLSCVSSAAFLSHASASSAARMQVSPALVRDRQRAVESHSSI